MSRTGNRGGFAPNEYRTDRLDVQSQPVRRRGKPAPDVSKPNSGPGQRIARIANTDALEIDGWNKFLPHLKSQNAENGTVRLAASMAIEFVSTPDMNAMLEAKYPNIYGDRVKIGRVRRKLEDKLHTFFLKGHQASFDIETDNQELAHLEFVKAMGDTRGDDPDAPAELTAAAAPLFGEGVFAVDGIEYYPDQGWSLNLGSNDVLRDERSSMVKFMKNELGLPTRMLSAGWSVIVPILKPSLAEAVTYTERLPTQVPFLAPHVYGMSDSLVTF